VKSVLTDNGSCYLSGLWKASCAEAQIKHRRTKRQTPRTNGKVERFNRTMKDEWLYVRAYTSEEDRRNHLVPFLNAYNHDRPHSAIGNRPPISRAPEPGPRLTHEPIELPPDHPGQLSLDLDP
jgi:transposase InsO family protein